MALNKVTYTDDVTVIEAQNLNEIQDEILRVDPSYITGKGIGNNADLNTFNTPGIYFCTSSTTAATLVNSPVTNAGFSLIVLPKSASYQTQIINVGAHLYSRQRSSTGWAAWFTCPNLEENNTFKGVVRVQQANSDTSNTQSLISVGNNIPEGTAGASYGGLQLYGSGDKYIFLRTPTTALGANRTVYFPDEAGTIAIGYKAGDTVSISPNVLQFAGCAQNTSTLRFTIPLTRPIYASNVSISGSLGVRCNGAWSDSFNVNTATQTCYVSPCGVVVVLAFSSARSYLTANCPVVIQPSGLTLTFS